jgi:DNA-directed RNA polymerase subunit omega
MTLPQNIESKFRFILIAAKRARQIQAGAKTLVQSQSKKPTRVAQQEVESGLVPIELVELDENGNVKVAKARAAK